MTIKRENKDLSDSEIAILLSPFSAHLSADQMGKVREYIRILLKWNELINLTAIIEPAEIIARHFGESMFLHSILPVENGRLADVGSGAGFPGIALKILSPGLQVVLIESNKRKGAFMAEVVRSLELLGAEILPMRFEEIRPQAGFANF